MESPRGNEFLKFFIGRENRSDSNREVPNVGYKKRIIHYMDDEKLGGPFRENWRVNWTKIKRKTKRYS